MAKSSNWILLGFFIVTWQYWISKLLQEDGYLSADLRRCFPVVARTQPDFENPWQTVISTQQIDVSKSSTLHYFTNQIGN